MEIQKMSKKDLDNIAGGADNLDIRQDGSIVFHNTCKTCGKSWEYRMENINEPFPNWATGPWCPECRKKQSEDFFKKSKN